MQIQEKDFSFFIFIISNFCFPDKTLQLTPALKPETAH